MKKKTTRAALETSPLERIQKIISRAGVASRRAAEEMITQGRVTVNGKAVTELGAKADPTKDRIVVDGEVISFGGPRRYILLNKPKGYITSLSDPRGRPVVTDLLKRLKARVFPVGRLDYDTEGVLLMTNDGELTNRLIHPRYKIPKTYLVKVRDVPDAGDIEKLSQGVYLEDGRTAPAIVRFVRSTKENSWIEITVTEGKNQLIKRMCMRIGHPVNKLKRIRFAGLSLGSLKIGEARPLTEIELTKLKAVAEGKEVVKMPARMPLRASIKASGRPARKKAGVKGASSNSAKAQRAVKEELKGGRRGSARATTKANTKTSTKGRHKGQGARKDRNR